MTTATLEKQNQQTIPSNRQTNTPATEKKSYSVVPRHRFERRDEALVFTAVLPGVAPNDLDIQVENERLVLKAEAPDVEMDGFRKVYGEISRNRYEASFKIPNQYDPASIQAGLEAGILTLTIAPRESAKPIRIPVATP